MRAGVLAGMVLVLGVQWGVAEEPALVEKGRVRLTLAGAEKMLAAGQKKAAEMKVKVNLAIVDDGGHLIAFVRMDGARPASIYTAMTKATTAATLRQETGPLPKGRTTDPLLNISLQNAAAVSGGKFTTLPGGVPVTIDEQVIGAIGVGGASGEQDLEVAKAAVAALMEGVKAAP